VGTKQVISCCRVLVISHFSLYYYRFIERLKKNYNTEFDRSIIIVVIIIMVGSCCLDWLFVQERNGFVITKNNIRGDAL